MAKENGDLEIVTEVGVFGSLNIDDPTTKKVKAANGEETVEELIKEATAKNLSNLSR